MIFFKKLILLTTMGGGIGIPIFKTYGIPKEDIKMKEYDSTIKKWNNILSSIPGKSQTEKVSLLLSRNLTTFSKNTVENVVKQLLMSWIINIWKNPENFYPISQKLNKFFFYYHFHQWETKNNLDGLSWELVKNFFTDFFFKEKGWFLISQFGDFKNFVFQEWLKKEKPFAVYEWSIKYSGDGKEEIFSSDSYKNSSKSSNKNYLWPKFKKNLQYKTFISNLKSQKSFELNKQFQRRVITLSELQKITDGRKLSILLHLLNLSSRESNPDNQDEIDKFDLVSHQENDILEHPLLLFLEKFSDSNGQIETEQDNKNCLLINKSIFKDAFWKKIPIKKTTNNSSNHVCLYGLKEIKYGFIPGLSKIFTSRESDGITFYHLPIVNKFNYSSFESSDKDTSEYLSVFLKDNFEKVFFKYLLSKKDKNLNNLSFRLTLKDGKKQDEWSFKNYFEKHSEIFGLVDSYLEQLYWSENIKKFSSILSSTYKEVPTSFKLEGKNGKKKILLNEKDGLFSPLPFKRELDSSQGEKEIVFSELRSKENGNPQKENKRKNDGFYSKLFNGFVSESDIYSLEEKANKLQEKLKSSNNQNQELIEITSLENIFKNSLLQRAQLEDFSGNKSLVVNTTFLERIKKLFEKLGEEEEEKQEEKKETQNISNLIQNFSSFMDSVSEEELESNEEEEGENSNSQSNGWKQLVEETFFLDNWLNLPTEERSIFGNYKNPEESSESDNSTDSIITKSKNSWILRNYYLSDAAYESNSKGALQELLSYFYSIYWLTKDNYRNLSKLVNHIIGKSSNKNAYLVWLKEVTQEELKKLSGETQEDSKNEEEQNILKQLHSSFTKVLPNDLLNPLLSGETQISSEQNEKSFHLNKTIFETKAFDSEENKKIKLSGFLGLISPKFSTRSLPEELKNAIFEKFWLSNNSKNTNYSSLSDSEDQQEEEKVLEGLFFEDNWKINLENNNDLKELINSLHLKRKLNKYLNVEDSIRPNSTLLQALHSFFEERKKEVDIDYWTIEELKRNIEEMLDNDNEKQLKTVDSSQISTNKLGNIKNLFKMWNRFSGFLQTDLRNKSPYIFTVERGGQKQHFLTFLYQVNQFDFEEKNISNLKKNISTGTLNMLVSLLASNKEAREWIYNNELIKQLN